VFEWSAEILQPSTLSVAVFPAAFLLGLIGSVTSCCNRPALGAVVGYAGTAGYHTDRQALFEAGSQ